MNRVVIAGLLLALGTAGCTVSSHARLPGAGPGEIFVTTGDLEAPYESLGPLQVTRRGVFVFGFLDPAGLTLDRVLEEALVPEVRAAGADGLINVRFEETQYLTVTRAFFAFPFFFIPLPGEVTIRGELVRLSGPVGGTR